MIKRLLYSMVLIGIAGGSSACASLGYYMQSIQGQLEVLQKSIPIETLVQEGKLSPDISNKLSLALQLREFASREFYLPDNMSYRRYADLGRDYVVWNVFATPELSLQGRQWCFLMVGCLSYRGYFSETEAREHAKQLETMGDDVFAGGVAAYSTLGWFADPVLNTMLHRDDFYLARVIFHELAHQMIFIRDDTEFNEAFADSVAETGVQRWLMQTQPALQQIAFRNMLAREDDFTALVLRYREQLDAMYQSNLADADKRQRKGVLLKQLQSDYQLLKTSWNGDTTYDAWFAAGLNNAKLMAVATYRRYLPGFRQLLISVNNDPQAFYLRVEALGDCGQEQRREILLAGDADFSC